MLNFSCSGGSSSGHRLLVFRPVCEFEEIDISKALNMPGRLAYPKVAKPSKLDEFYHRRLQLKAVEERTLALTAEVRANLLPATTHIIIVLKLLDIGIGKISQLFMF